MDAPDPRNPSSYRWTTTLTNVLLEVRLPVENCTWGQIKMLF